MEKNTYYPPEQPHTPSKTDAIQAALTSTAGFVINGYSIFLGKTITTRKYEKMGTRTY